MSDDIRRRQLLGSIGVAAATGVLAGCSTETRGDGGDGGAATDADTATNAATATSGGGGGSGSVPSEVSEYLSDTSNFDGSAEDHTGESEVTVMVGAEGNNGNYAFAPAAIRVDTGTTVVWEWTGQGQVHNVVHEDGDFESEQVSEEGHTFEYTFEESGNYLYQCTPHQALGMLGAVIVE